MGKKKDRKMVVEATREDYELSGLAAGTLALWSCDAFGMERTSENARMVWAMAWGRARDAQAAREFAEDPNGFKKR